MDKGSEVMKIVEWYLNGQGVCFSYNSLQNYKIILYYCNIKCIYFTLSIMI